MQFATAKENLRASIKKQGSHLTEEERKEKDLKISERFFSLGIEKYKRVFIYVSFEKEVETKAIIGKLLERDSEVYVPLCHGKGIMEAKRMTALSELKSGRYGIYEPLTDAESCSPEELDLIVVPGVAFGEDCTRLGRGAGYYDRFLDQAKNAVLIALSREENIRKTVPCDDHDQLVDIIVTEDRSIKRKEKRGI